MKTLHYIIAKDKKTVNATPIPYSFRLHVPFYYDTICYEKVFVINGRRSILSP